MTNDHSDLPETLYACGCYVTRENGVESDCASDRCLRPDATSPGPPDGIFPTLVDIEDREAREISTVEGFVAYHGNTEVAVGEDYAAVADALAAHKETLGVDE